MEDSRKRHDHGAMSLSAARRRLMPFMEGPKEAKCQISMRAE
jgi:hypothetical protein